MNRADPSAEQPGAEYFSNLPFRPDRFQTDAVAAFGEGASVVVTAPTGAGKTLVAEAAVNLVQKRGLRSFYTTPIKALSNQKFSDFRDEYGADQVGLLTGDNVINGGAPIVVMTTEVLRNMIYADSSALEGLGVVILDEVHYLQDRQRGSVWEEVIIHLPHEVPIIALSATVANAAEFTDWIASRRGDTRLIIEEHRPVPLTSQYMLKDRNREGAIELFPVFDRRGVKPNPDVLRLMKKNRGRHRRFSAPRRLEVIRELARHELIPLIYFIFSRKGCDQGADLVAEGGLGLTTSDERSEIRAVAEARTAHLTPDDLTVLGYARWLANLEKGVAAHHAGLVPAFKETAEELFRSGLVKVVFATETLALGINMPARSVVLERLSKFTGEGHDLLRPGDYTQLTGRAGRRGIDDAGTAVVLYDYQVPFDRVAAIAAAGSHPLASSFQPTYNMAVNLVANYDRKTAEKLLRASFSQFRAERRSAQLAARADVLRSQIAELRQSVESSYGDIWEVAAGGQADTRSLLRDFAQSTEPGDIFEFSPDPEDRWILLARGYGANPRLVFVDSRGTVRRISADEIPAAVSRLGGLALPDPVKSRETRYQRHAARLLRAFEPGDAVPTPALETEVSPILSDPDLKRKLADIKRLRRLEKDLGKLDRRKSKVESGLVAAFEMRLSLLEDRGYTSGWSLTPQGERLRFLYNELDLVLAECVDAGLLSDLDPAEVAAVASMFTYEPRSADVLGDWPSARVAERGTAIWELSDEVAETEEKRRIEPVRTPDPGFSAVAFDWTEGASLEDLFGDDEVAAGDFVRNMRQLLDLLRQLRDTYPDLADSIRRAIKQIDRGVVAAGGQR
ncbi:MAG: DEAD/DEAH box helicase [bacterium]|nr:DEAD/DEAH box helicase [bacterium]